jgi:hypothetical protein
MKGCRNVTTYGLAREKLAMSRGESSRFYSCHIGVLVERMSHNEQRAYCFLEDFVSPPRT